MTRTGCTCDGTPTLCSRCTLLLARSTTPPATAPRPWRPHEEAPEPEKGFMWRVIRLAEARSWTYYHVHDARRSPEGFPDLVLCRDTILYVECKTNIGQLTMPQQRWLSLLAQAGAEAYCWRPRDWPAIEARLTRQGGPNAPFPA